MTTGLRIEDCLDRALKLGAGEAELYLEHRRETSLKVYRGEVEELSAAAGRGAGMRVFRDHRLGFAYTTDLSEAGLERLVKEAVENAAFSAPDEHQGLPDPAEFSPLDCYDASLDGASVEDKVGLAVAAERLALERDGRVRSVRTLRYTDRALDVELATSRGFRGQYRANGCFMLLQAQAESAGDVQTGFAFVYGRSLAALDPERLAAEAVDHAVSLLGARQAPGRTVPVVFEAHAGAMLAGILLSQALSADAVQKNRSLFCGREDSRVASELVTVVDDGRLPQGLASAPFDGEGTPTGRSVLIDGGVLKGFLHDSYTARKAGRRSTGNAARESFRAVPAVLPTNLFVAPGDSDPEEIVGEVRDGLYAMDLSGLGTGGANPISGHLSLGVNGRWIRGGKLAEPVREMTVAGHLLDLLRDIDAVGSDLRFVPVWGFAGAPTFRVARLAVGGA